MYRVRPIDRNVAARRAEDDAASDPGRRHPDTRAGGKKTVGIISPALTSTFHVALTDGFTEQGAAYGWTVVAQAPDRENNFAEQINEVQAMVQNKVAAQTIKDLLDGKPVNKMVQTDLKIVDKANVDAAM